MTDYKRLSDSELTEALNFHRRQRNMSRGINEAAHMRQTQVVRLLEAEEARRLNEEKPNHYIVSKRKNGEYGVSQDVGNNVWDHSYHHGTHKTVDAAKAWAVKHAGKYPHKIEVHEEVEQIDENEDWMNDRLSGKYKNNHGSGGTAEVSKHPKKGYWYLKHSDGHNHDVPVNTRHLRSYIKRGWLVKEEVELDEAVQVDKKNYSWGKMITVRHGSSHSFPLHPEHQEKIKNLKDGESTVFKDETGSHVTASREGDKVHLKLRGANQKTTVAHSHFTEEVELGEQIKGWKHAASDISKMRAAQGKNVKLVSLKKDGTESKMHDAAKMFSSEGEAQEHHDRVTKLNPKSKIRHNLYVDGKHVKTLGEEVEQIDEVSASTLRSYIDKSRADKKAAMKDRTAAEKNVKQYGMASDKKERDDAARRVVNRNQGISVANKKLGTYPTDKAKAKVMAREEVELDENIAGKFKDASEWEKAAKSRGLVVKSMTHPSGEMTKYQIAKDKEGNNRGHFDHGTKSGHLKEEVELDEASYRDIGYRNMLKASQKADKEAEKMRKKQANKENEGSKPEEFKEESNLRITKIYNKWPKKATYAVHTPDRKYFKEFDSMEAAKAHHKEKSGE